MSIITARIVPPAKQLKMKTPKNLGNGRVANCFNLLRLIKLSALFQPKVKPIKHEKVCVP
jgi:hypothetical protein